MKRYKINLLIIYAKRNKNMSKCIVTGGCGFIGSHIVDRLCDDGHDVIVIDDLSAPENEEFYYNENVKKS